MRAREASEALDTQNEPRPETPADISLVQRKAGDDAAAADTMNAVAQIANPGNRVHAF